MRLTHERVQEICGSFLDEPGSMFPCHKTVEQDEDDEGRWSERPDWHMCAGGLILAEKVRPDRPVQMIQLAERFGMYDRSKLRGWEDVFDSVKEMLATAIGRRRRK